MEFREDHLTARDGTRLFLRDAVVPGRVKANVVLTHGRGEHSGRYIHVAAAFAARGLRICTYDLRGHGRSGGARGDAASYSALLEDLQLVIARVEDGSTPLFLFGHSLGGQITINHLLTHQTSCRGVVIASPYLRLAFVPKRWRLAVAHAARWLWPSLGLETILHSSLLSRDEAHLAALPDVELVHHRISARMYHAIRRGAADALAGASQLRVPLLLLQGADDPVTSVEATREFHARVGSADKTLALYPGMLHETHNELDRTRVITDIVEWIEARLRMKEM